MNSMNLRLMGSTVSISRCLLDSIELPSSMTSPAQEGARRLRVELRAEPIWFGLHQPTHEVERLEPS